MNNFLLESLINEKLNSNIFQDVVPNGLQIEGKSEIQKILCAVTACQAVLDIAVLEKYDAIIVHHGYFWKNEDNIIKGIKRNRLKTILSNDINLYCWHLPLDDHKTLGNNVQIAKQLQIKIFGKIAPYVLWGKFDIPILACDLKQKITKVFGRIPFHCGGQYNKKIKTIAWCSGKGQNFINIAANSKMDAFLTGEVSEETVHIAKENNMHFFSAGHHATECAGIQYLGSWIKKKYNLNVNFINIFNPI
ncbi:Nif3-like dinuclear metal center hexameric protein [Buchnera aphidicola (Thelaxes californica)]|uniref:GTP cyclohydrolase 1 type 2 homolog n=1 Tax=Buchnera aphidicola (Thelaxes californica) TaxID=1315998 RepID=A0A4D6YLB4_9GAMM|nr:Nif3-like dinuclear metal center hexameric protein [Buchnera aphidicola]QCI26764.1 Nif3-like dinuclear metal center hexameric protein [Buchnera aphidicola (Thelaxes californica)]